MGQPREPAIYLQQLVALSHALQKLREENNVEILIQTALGFLQSEFDYQLVWLGFYDRVEHRVIGKGGRIPGGDPSFLKQRFVLSPGDLLEQVVIQQRSLGIPDLRQETRAGVWCKLAQKLGIQGTLIFPISHQDRCFGVVLLASTLWGVSPRNDEKSRLVMVLGELATALHHLDIDQQRQQTKHSEAPLLNLLTQLRSLSSLNLRLEAVVEETHRFIAPARTTIYWFDRERRLFWKRITNGQRGATVTKAPGSTGEIAVRDVGGFYQALGADQLVSIGESQSSLKADLTGRLMQLLRARSLIAAPIIFQHELLGFLAVEGNEPRVWQDTEKNFAKAAAQLVALTVPLAEMEDTIQQVKLDQALTAEIAQAIYTDEDWKTTLRRCGEKLGQRLRTKWLWVLLYNPDQRLFEICYQSQTAQAQRLSGPLNFLSPVDQQMLENSLEAIGVENLEDDLKLMAWRPTFLEIGARSLLVCSTSLGRSLEGLVVVGQDIPRTWSTDEREVLRVVSQQIGLILHQWQLQNQTEQQQKMVQTVQWGLTMLQQTQHLEQLETLALQHLAQVLQVPLVAMVAWSPGRSSGQIHCPIVPSPEFSLNTAVAVSVQTDVLIQWGLQADGLLPLCVHDLAPETRYWLNGTAIGQILIMALRTAPDHEPTGIVIVADHLDRHWPERHLAAMGTLVSQLAWSRRYLLLTESLHTQQQDLERLNWYKQRRIEELYRSLSLIVRRLNELANAMVSSLAAGNPGGDLAGQRFAKNPLLATQHQQILRQMGDLLTTTGQLIKEEQWRLRTNTESMPLATLLKRAIERIEGLIKQKQIWSQVHNTEGNLVVSGDIFKVELVLYEILSTACQRCQPGGRIDIWCRPLDQRWLELSITDNGTIEPRLIEELQAGRSGDLLVPSILDHPPGLNLVICQALMQLMGGEYTLYKLEDGRVLSRLVLPLIPPTVSYKVPGSQAQPASRI